jgi:hypothetical protein
MNTVKNVTILQMAEDFLPMLMIVSLGGILLP